MSEKTTACPNCGGNQWITRERSDGTQITRCVMCNTARPKSETTRRPLDWYGPEDYDGYADPAEEIARVAAQQAEWDAALDVSWLDQRFCSRRGHSRLHLEHHVTQPETTRGVAFSKEELHIFRQWFENVQDVNPVYLAPKDYRLARHVYQCLQWVVPGSVEEKCNG